MEEPTFKQYKILEKISITDGIYRKGDETDIDDIYVLVRAGYVKNLVCMGGKYDWKFIIVEQGEQYLSALANERSQQDNNGDLVPFVWMIEKLRRREGGCTMNELVAEAKRNFKGIEQIKHRTINYH